MDAVIFDVDGTLVDSERDGHRVAFNLAFEELGLPYRWDIDLYGALLEVTGGQRRLHAYLEGEGVPAGERDELVPKLHARKTELFRELVADGKVDPRPGAVELLEDLTGAGLRLAVATTGSRGWVEPLLERLFAGVPFDPVITGDDVPARKPDPSAYVMALGRLGLPPAGALAVEDSDNGLVAAHAAGLACVVVFNDYTADQELSQAELVVAGFDELDVATLRRAHEQAQRG
ncbi:MAG: HAD-IA family hydrolase [Actinobacteria bacterium]|nr:HAD-IA family hydrolase [Actinomycetota bacterium]MBW3643480.1 HAD-IA family hydrolase [Actinomycetota bacterium]